MKNKDLIKKHVKLMSSLKDEFHENLKKVFDEYVSSLNILLKSDSIPDKEKNFIIFVVTKYIIEVLVPNFIGNLLHIVTKCVEEVLIHEIINETIDGLKIVLSNALNKDKVNLDEIKPDAMFTA